MQPESSRLAFFGKTPLYGDFVRYNANAATVRAMDAWLQQALYYARAHIDGAFQGGLTYPFAFDPGEDGKTRLIGVMRPSRDSVGRIYPFLIGAEVEVNESDRASIAQLPVLYEGFWQQAGAMARAAAAGQLNRHDLAAHAGSLNTHLLNRMSVFAYQQYLKQTAITFFWERLWQYSEDSRKYLLFKNLLDILLPLRSGVPPGFSLVLRFPLPPDGRLTAYDASLWLDICLRLLGVPALQPTFFWTQPDVMTGTPPFLLLTLRPPQARTLAYLLETEPDGDTLCHLETMGDMSAAHAALSIPARYGELLEASYLSIWDFLQRLQD